MKSPEYNAITKARRTALDKELKSLGEWCLERGLNEHDTDTTITMLNRKIAMLKNAVNSAGWKEAEKFHYKNK